MITPTLPARDTVKLSPEVAAMLKLAGVQASYIHSGQWMLWLYQFTKYTPIYPNYADFARCAAELVKLANE